ncbi:MAG: Lrp/AsnC family transcriptional regulator [Candidatus Riflebacteria bacterium HGW-Riflebacteria-1]|jgi:DNA-binding Lrp family transcriptional regulator|nr:MAG: Lrp/AsnC family transcriptional regulator [Candidatus Riflebacteria bacterium HGW-Riflebacteria-1]
MDTKTRQVLSELQDGFKLETRPFKRIANQVGCSEEEVLEIIKRSREEGLIRRIGAAVRPGHLGHTANALVVWQVAEERIEEVGTALAEMREISHCYERECPPNWPYNLFTMIHARSEEELDQLIADIFQRFSLGQYKVLRTVKELKKTSMRYFEDAAK